MALKAKKRKLSQRLGGMVKRRFKKAEDANVESHRRCFECLQYIDGKISTYEDDNIDDDDALKVSMNITLPLTEQLHSMMIDVLDPIKAQPFTLEPAPIATLPDDVEDDLLEAIQSNIEALIEQSGADPDAMSNIISHMYQTTLKYEQSEAQQRADALTTVISDKLKKSDFEEEFDSFLHNFIVYPSAFMKGPVPTITKVKTWNGSMMVVSESTVSKVYNVNPFDIFPSPNARDLNTCDYVIERARFSSNDLYDMFGAPGFDTETITHVIDLLDCYIIPYSTTGQKDAPDLDPDTTAQEEEHQGFYDTLIYYGRIHGEDLEEFGVEVDNPRKLYEAEVWVIDDWVIKAVLNPDPLDRRPYYTTSIYKRPGELWGRSIVEVVRDAQLQCTAAGRALVRNMGFSSGPMGEVDNARILGDDDPTEIYPGMMRAVKSTTNGTTAAAYRWYSVPSLANELIGVFDKFSQIAYQLVGIPNIAFGNMQGASTLGRTSGGISMVMNQASKPIKKAMRNVESKVVEPLIQKFVDNELMYSTDDTIKGDVNVSATGIRGLQEKEQQEGKLEWALQSIAPYAQGVSIPPEYFLRLLKKVLDANGIPTDDLPDFDLNDAMERDLGQLGLAGGAETPQTPTQPNLPNFTENLDGRSQGAIDTINQGGAYG